MAQAATVIAAGTTVSGRIEGAEDITVLGAIKGSVQLEGALLVDEAARVEADCTLTDLEVHGILVGNVTASESVELHKTARVIGDISAPRVIVHEGALYRGLLDMGEAVADAAPAGRRRAAPARSSAPRGRSTRPATRRPTPAPEAQPPVAATPAPEPKAEPAPKVVKKKAATKAKASK